MKQGRTDRMGRVRPREITSLSSRNVFILLEAISNTYRRCPTKSIILIKCPLLSSSFVSFSQLYSCNSSTYTLFLLFVNSFCLQSPHSLHLHFWQCYVFITLICQYIQILSFSLSEIFLKFSPSNYCLQY